MKRFTFTLPEPPSANRWWRTTVIPAGKGRPARVNTYLSPEARAYKADVARVGSKFLLDGPVSVSVIWYRSRAAGDLDKRLGVMLDAMQGVFYTNDSQIVELRAARLDTEKGNPRLVVTVSEVDPQGSVFST